MRLTELFYKAIGENLLTEGVHEYGCVMLYFPVSDEFWSKIQSRVEDDELASELDDEGGEKKGRTIASEAHVTLLYGYKDTISDEDVEAIIDKFEPVDITLRKLSTFDNEEFDVLKFDVEGDKLFEYNKLLSELPNETKFPNYHPHLTVAYLKKGIVTPDMIQDLPEDETLTVKANKVVYSKPDGSKKEYKL